MKYVKILCLLAVGAAAMTAFAASASADTWTTTTPSGTVETPTVHWVNEGGHVTLANPIANISCSLTIEKTVTTHEKGKPVVAHLNALIPNGCTNSWHVTTITAGTVSAEASNGEVKSSGAKVDTTRLGVTCVYETSNTKIGTITGGSPATLHIEASIPINTGESSGLCGTGNAKWEGDLVSTTPLHTDDN